MLNVKKLDGKWVRVGDKETYFDCKIFQFKNKVDLQNMLKRRFQFDNNNAEEVAIDLHERYLSKL